MSDRSRNIDSFSGPSFSFKNRLGRAVWNLVYIFLFRFSPVPFYAWRSFLLRIFGAGIGNGTHIYPNVKIWAPWNITVGNQVGIGSGATLYSQAPITIGFRAVISQKTYLCTGTHDYTKSGMPIICKPITIGARAWVAADAFIHPGVTVGEGCVIGARSVVTTNMPDWMVCAGHPCKPIKKRIFDNNKPSE